MYDHGWYKARPVKAEAAGAVEGNAGRTLRGTCAVAYFQGTGQGNPRSVSVSGGRI